MYKKSNKNPLILLAGLSIILSSLVFGFIGGVPFIFDRIEDFSISYVVGVILFTIQFISGIYLYREIEIGKTLTMISQITQALNFQSNNFRYYFCSGFNFSISNENKIFGIIFKPLNIKFEILVDAGNDMIFWINLIPIAIIYILYKPPISRNSAGLDL